MVNASRSVLALGLLASALQAQKYYTYVGNLSADSALLAWGKLDGVNTIGRSSVSHGEATVRIAGRTFTSRQNWIVAPGLQPDRVYPYTVELNGRVIADSALQTWAARDDKLVFFVIGDYGTGNRNQQGIARAMRDEYFRRSASGNPVRFVITVGDNIYGDVNNFLFGVKNTGSQDSDWESKFFAPYEEILRHVPFYPTLGNHDGNETENRGDLAAYLDNFFFPNDKPSRWYQFNYGGLADFFALDSTTITESGAPSPQWLQNGPQWRWMRSVLPASTAAWKIPYFHHPPFNAGPRHGASVRDLQHWVDLFAQCGVKVSFQGHEHNFQVTETNAETRGIRFVIAGSGGEQRTADVTRRLARANMAAFSPQNEFLSVEIRGKTMLITPLGYEPIKITDANRAPVPLPISITIP